MSFTYEKKEYAITTWTLEHMPLREALDTLNSHGYKNVEIWADTVHLDPRCNPNISETKEQLHRLGMSVHSLHAPFRNYKNPLVGEKAFRCFRIAIVKKTIDYAYELGSNMIVLHAVDRNEYNYSLEHLEAVRDYVGEIAHYASKSGVQVAIEDIPQGNCSDELITTLENQKALFGDLGVKYCLDIGHTVLLGADFFKEIDSVGDDLITFHIHNNHGSSDDHYLPDDGVIDWPSLHDYVRNRGFVGEFVLEIYGGPNKASERNILERIDRLF